MQRTALLLLSLGLTSPLSAQNRLIDEPFSLSAGGFWNRADATFSSTLDSADPVELNLADLGMDRRANVLWAEASWRFAPTWQADLSWSSFSDDGLIETEGSGNFGDVDWDFGASLATEFDLDLAIANLTWDFHQTDRSRLGVGLGIHMADLDFGLSARFEAVSEQGEVEEVVESTDRNLIAPLPNIALKGSWLLSENLLLRAYAGYFSLAVDKYDGGLVSGRVAAEWFPWDRNIGLGAAVQFLDVTLDIDRSNRTDEFDIDFFGPIAYATVRF